jgi:hypothetical protein
LSPPKPVTPVPPRVAASVPVQPRVILAARNSEVAGVPPSVRVTLVSSVLVRAAPVISDPASVALTKFVPSPRRTLPVVAAPFTLYPVTAFTVPVNEAALEMVWPLIAPLVSVPFKIWLPETFRVPIEVDARVDEARVADVRMACPEAFKVPLTVVLPAAVVKPGATKVVPLKVKPALSVNDEAPS